MAVGNGALAVVHGAREVAPGDVLASPGAVPSTRVMDCALFDGPSAFIAGVEPQGKFNVPIVPGKITILKSTNWTDWTPMTVDYKAEARSVILARL